MARAEGGWLMMRECAARARIAVAHFCVRGGLSAHCGSRQVLAALTADPKRARQPAFKPLRTAVCSFQKKVVGMFDGMGQKEYSSKAERKRRAKARRESRAKEDRRRIERTRFKKERMERLEKLCRLTEGVRACCAQWWHALLIWCALFIGSIADAGTGCFLG